MENFTNANRITSKWQSQHDAQDLGPGPREEFPCERSGANPFAAESSRRKEFDRAVRGLDILHRLDAVEGRLDRIEGSNR